MVTENGLRKIPAPAVMPMKQEAGHDRHDNMNKRLSHLIDSNGCPAALEATTTRQPAEAGTAEILLPQPKTATNSVKNHCDIIPADVQEGRDKIFIFQIP